MKVFTKIFGAVLLLGCLAYISFVFGKYVLSSTLLKSIPPSQRVISADSPPPTLASKSGSPATQNFAPQVKMRVLPSTRSPRERSTHTSDSITNTSDPDDSQEGVTKPKRFDEGEVSSPRRRRSRRQQRRTEATEESSKPETSTAASAPTPSPTQKKPAPPSTPIRRLNQEEKKETKSPVPQAEKSTSKSTSTPSTGNDAGSISPVPKPG